MRVIEKKGLPCLLPEQRGTMPGHMPQIPVKSGIRHPGRILAVESGHPAPSLPSRRPSANRGSPYGKFFLY